MPSSLPPYLTSGASSRSHHALLVKLQEANSDQEEDDIVEKEVTRQKELMGVRGQSTSRIAESLIVLLHIAMIRHDTNIDIDFGLVHALHLAESGRTIQDKRIGYLFLQERLAPGHELALMLINTVRKDLTSSSTAHILLALHTIVKMPSRVLTPAVTPRLTSKALLKHILPAIRQRTIQAICALHRKSGNEGFPLSMSKLVRMSSAEEDESVLAVVVGTIKIVLEGGMKSIGSLDEAFFLCEHMINIATDRLEESGQLLLNCLGVLRQIMCSPYGQDCDSQISSFLDLVLPPLSIDEPADGAILLEICHLVAAFKQASKASPGLLAAMSRGLLPAARSPTTSQVPYIPKPNTLVLVIRCLHILPVPVWDGQLGEAEMGVIMEGLNSPDGTVRRSTLRLLQRLSPELLETSLGNHLQALKTSTDLSLPLDVPANLAEKTIAGRLETSGRALEVVEVMFCQQPSLSHQLENGLKCALSFVDIVAALNEGVQNTVVVSESRGGLGSKGQVWEEGLRRMLLVVEESSDDFRTAFTTGIIDSRIGSATLAVLRCTALTRTGLSPETAERAVQVLLEDLADFGPSVQEIVLVALVVILSQVEYDQDAVVQVLGQVQLEAGKYIKKRCGQVVDLIQQNLLDEVVKKTNSRSIPDVLEAITAVHKRWAKVQRIEPKSLANTPASPARSASNGPSSLRYEAYEPPSGSLSLAHMSISRSRESRSSTRAVSKSSINPGDLALFDADEEDGILSGPRSRAADNQARLGRIAIPEGTGDGLDPFMGDEARTPTMRESRHIGT